MNAMKHILAGFGTVAALMTAACSQSPDTGTEAESQFQGRIEKSGIGEVKATIDGSSYRGATFEVPSEDSSTAGFRSLGPVTTVSLQAHDPDAESVMSNVLSIDFTVTGNDASAPLSGAAVSYFPAGMSEPFYSSESSEPAPQVSLSALSLDDGAAFVTGRFAANLCRKADFFSEADGSDCMAVEGTFESDLREST